MAVVKEEVAMAAMEVEAMMYDGGPMVTAKPQLLLPSISDD